MATNDSAKSIIPASVFMTPARAPLSGAKDPKPRRSRSEAYDKAEYEWNIKLTPTLPEIWVRDISKISVPMMAQWDSDWRHYCGLCIPGKGDGAGLDSHTRHGRRKLKAEYKRLDPKVRAAKEIALARWSPFCMKSDGELDYHTGEKDGTSCVVM